MKANAGCQIAVENYIRTVVRRAQPQVLFFTSACVYIVLLHYLRLNRARTSLIAIGQRIRRSGASYRFIATAKIVYAVRRHFAGHELLTSGHLAHLQRDHHQLGAHVAGVVPRFELGAVAHAHGAGHDVVHDITGEIEPVVQLRHEETVDGVLKLSAHGDGHVRVAVQVAGQDSTHVHFSPIVHDRVVWMIPSGLHHVDGEHAPVVVGHANHDLHVRDLAVRVHPGDVSVPLGGQPRGHSVDDVVVLAEQLEREDDVVTDRRVVLQDELVVGSGELGLFFFRRGIGIALRASAEGAV